MSYVTFEFVSACIYLCFRLRVSGSMMEQIREVLTSGQPPGAAQTISKR